MQDSFTSCTSAGNCRDADCNACSGSNQGTLPADSAACELPDIEQQGQCQSRNTAEHVCLLSKPSQGQHTCHQRAHTGLRLHEVLSQRMLLLPTEYAAHAQQNCEACKEGSGVACLPGICLKKAECHTCAQLALENQKDAATAVVDSACTTEL